MVEDCIGRGKSLQEGGAVYNFTGPQGFGVANMADALYAIKTLVYDEKKVTMAEMRDALAANFGEPMADSDAGGGTTIVWTLPELPMRRNTSLRTACSPRRRTRTPSRRRPPRCSEARSCGKRSRLMQL